MPEDVRMGLDVEQDNPKRTLAARTCLRCGHHWTPIDPDARRCAKCKSSDWDRLPRSVRGLGELKGGTNG